MRMAILAIITAAGLSTTALAGEGTRILQAKVVKKSEGTKAVASRAGSFTATECSQGEHKRHLEITFEDAATRLPCEVHYRKTTEQPGHDQVLWSAKNDAGFCERKATEFVGKLQGWGWNCSEMQARTAH